MLLMDSGKHTVCLYTAGDLFLAHNCVEFSLLPQQWFCDGINLSIFVRFWFRHGLRDVSIYPFSLLKKFHLVTKVLFIWLRVRFNMYKNGPS